MINRSKISLVDSTVFGKGVSRFRCCYLFAVCLSWRGCRPKKVSSRMSFENPAEIVLVVTRRGHFSCCTRVQGTKVLVDLLLVFRAGDLVNVPSLNQFHLGCCNKMTARFFKEFYFVLCHSVCTVSRLKCWKLHSEHWFAKKSIVTFKN